MNQLDGLKFLVVRTCLECDGVGAKSEYDSESEAELSKLFAKTLHRLGGQQGPGDCPVCSGTGEQVVTLDLTTFVEWIKRSSIELE